ncbi:MULTISPECIES: pyridoxal phosphate-dependent decarboxylase family protein [unclassified Psychrobacter]|uniref:pyridoxal phosphate-dependent decarboxylase family protein n=1 Tax=unclassified Psychrobacter TaxID=196806 RepID=UPI0018F65B42|nr:MULTISPECIES: aspartate aminotransferase family protein [unclassified Psychrobacter]
MYILNQQTSHDYVAASAQTSAMIQQWLDAESLYQGGAPAALQDKLTLNISKTGRDIDMVLGDIAQQFLPNCVSTAHPHCAAHLHPPTLWVGQVAEMIIAATNQSMDSWNQSPAATYIEKELIQWLGAQCGFNSSTKTEPKAGGVFTSGGTQSNLMGLLLARNRFYGALGVDVQKDGLAGQPLGRILCSEQAHFSVEKNAALLGLGQRSVVKIATDRTGAMDMAHLEDTIDRFGAQNIMAVVATAGTTDLGAIDPLESIAEVCQAAGIWLHVDAAWGGALLLSERYRDMLAGIARADSITLDFHKHFFLPISCGAFLVKDAENFASIRLHSDYLNPSDDETDDIPNLVTYSLQTTRRFDALKLAMALDVLGTDAYGALIDAGLDNAKDIAQRLDSDPDFVLVRPPILSSVLFYFAPQNSEFSAESLAKINRHIAQNLLINNQANIATTQYDGHLCLKFTLLNPDSTLAAMNPVIAQIAALGHAYLVRDFK